jgi:hypothetical protein
LRGFSVTNDLLIRVTIVESPRSARGALSGIHPTRVQRREVVPEPVVRALFVNDRPGICRANIRHEGAISTILLHRMTVAGRAFRFHA